MMQKEDLLKRMKVWTSLITTAFVFLIVGLLIQFGFIAYYHTSSSHLQASNVALEEEIEDLENERNFIENDPLWEQQFWASMGRKYERYN